MPRKKAEENKTQMNTVDQPLNGWANVTRYAMERAKSAKKEAAVMQINIMLKDGAPFLYSVKVRNMVNAQPAKSNPLDSLINDLL